MFNTTSLENKRFFVKIQAGPGSGGNPCIYFNKDFVFKNFMKWKWYFDYRAALYKVQNPKHTVHLSTGSYDFTPPIEHQIKNLLNKIIAAKAKITKWQRVVKNYEDSWNQLFPYTDEPDYIKCKKKISDAIIAYNIMVIDLSELEKQR